jgi:hypothetical protein
LRFGRRAPAVVDVAGGDPGQERCPALGSKKPRSETRPGLAVDLRRFELLTPSMRTRCATRLRHRPFNESEIYHMEQVVLKLLLPY